jgi:hypothetical protein
MPWITSRCIDARLVFVVYIILPQYEMLSAKDECWYSKSMCDAVVERERDNETNKNRMSECILERGRERG